MMARASEDDMGCIDCKTSEALSVCMAELISLVRKENSSGRNPELRKSRIPSLK
jgi:hypothetical protein